MSDLTNFDIVINMLASMRDAKSLNLCSAKEIFFSTIRLKKVRKATIIYYRNLFYRLDDDFKKFSISETSDLDTLHVNKLIDYWLNEELSANYINKMIKAIRYMLKVIAKQGAITPPKLDVELLREDEHRIDKIEDNELKDIISYVLNQSLKVQAIVFILLVTGVRRTELTEILLENVNMDEKTILLETTKVGEVRTVFFTDEVKETLKKYLEEYKPVKYLFEVRPGIKNSPLSISRILERIKNSLNLDTLSAHKFRHTFATMLYEMTNDIEYTRILLGHHDTTMTKRYIHHSTKKNKERYDELNIKFKKE